jgi:hypothetical protein
VREDRGEDLATGFSLAWVALPAALLALLLADAPFLGEVDPCRSVQALQVGFALYLFPFAVRGAGGAARRRAIAAAVAGLPLTLLARRLAGEPPFEVGLALPPLALFAAAGFFRGKGGGIAGWTATTTLVGFGLPWLDLLASDFGRAPSWRIGLLSPIVPPGGGAPSAALLLAAALVANLLPGRRDPASRER